MYWHLSQVLSWCGRWPFINIICSLTGRGIYTFKKNSSFSKVWWKLVLENLQNQEIKLHMLSSLLDWLPWVNSQDNWVKAYQYTSWGSGISFGNLEHWRVADLLNVGLLNPFRRNGAVCTLNWHTICLYTLKSSLDYLYVL